MTSLNCTGFANKHWIFNTLRMALLPWKYGLHYAILVDLRDTQQPTTMPTRI